MKKFIFAFLTLLFTSFAFASPLLVEAKHKSEKVEFVKQGATMVTFVAVNELLSFYKTYREREVQSNQDKFISQSYISKTTINFNPVPITDTEKEWRYIIDKRNMARIYSCRNFNI